MTPTTETRAALLDAAFTEIHEHGFHATSLDAILARTGLTKGALYHHFKSKDELGRAVIDEIIGTYVREMWIGPVVEANNPIDGFIDAMYQAHTRLTPEDARCGCPLNNLTQEMAAADPEFHDHLAALHDEWREAITDALKRGQAAGQVRSDLGAQAMASFLIAANQGMAGQMKLRGEVGARAVLPAYRHVLESFRAGSDASTAYSSKDKS